MSSHRTTHRISDYKEPFTLIIQRTPKSGQLQLDLNQTGDEIETNGYTYRAIATSIDGVSDSEIINWYGARAEKSENKIKELMLDFGGAHMPCGQFEANALYFAICTLSYNLFVMLRQHLPEEFNKSRAKAVRLRIYSMAAKLIKHSRQFKLKLQKFNNNLLSLIIDKIKSYPFYPVL
ncbi:MAG: transposase [Proteobacteria bacterium]|nr:transposase [Pseudomonadota bacterium]